MIASQVVVSHSRRVAGRWCPARLDGDSRAIQRTHRGDRLRRVVPPAERALAAAVVARADRDVAITVLRRVRDDRWCAGPVAAPAPRGTVRSVSDDASEPREYGLLGSLLVLVAIVLGFAWHADLLPRHHADLPAIAAPVVEVDAISGGTLAVTP